MLATNLLPIAAQGTTTFRSAASPVLCCQPKISPEPVMSGTWSATIRGSVPV